MIEHEILQDGISYVPGKAAAKRVGLSPDYVARFCREGLVTATRYAGTWYVNENSLATYLADQERQREAYRWKLSTEAKEEAQRAKFSAAQMVAPYRPRRKKRSGLRALSTVALLTTIFFSSALAFEMVAPPGSTARASLKSNISSARGQLAAASSLPWLDAVAENF